MSNKDLTYHLIRDKNNVALGNYIKLSIRDYITFNLRRKINIFIKRAIEEKMFVDFKNG